MFGRQYRRPDDCRNRGTSKTGSNITSVVHGLRLARYGLPLLALYPSSGKVYASAGRQIAAAFCEEGHEEIEKDPSLCRPGGHACWTRIVEPTAEPEPSVPYSPRELPTAIDFLNTVWERAYNRSLFRLRSAEKTTAALSLGCTTQDEFRTRLQDLNELFKLMDIPDELVPESERPIDKGQTFTRMVACARGSRITDEAERERLRASVDGLRAVNTVRNKLTHGGGSELVKALRQLRIEYPISDYGKAWDSVRAKTAEALATIRSALQAAL